MELASLQAFISVARLGSFSLASEALYLTQPAVSKRVAALESQLDVQLFNRVAKNISLTEAGQQLLPMASEILQQAEDMKRQAAHFADSVSGSLKFGLSHHVALHRMPTILDRYRQLYPQVQLDIRFAGSDQALAMVERGELEFCVVTLPGSVTDRLIVEPIWLDPLAMVYNQDKLSGGEPVTDIQGLAKYPCVLPERTTETYKIMQRYAQKEQIELNVGIETNNLESLRMLVKLGIGWSLLPHTMIEPPMRRLAARVALSRTLGLVLHRQRKLSNAATVMRELISLITR